MLETRISILTIGDELLIGQVIDTNSAWMGQRLNQEGFEIHRRVAVGDQWADIWQALDTCMADSQLILITGGLGPTADDITKPLLCEYFGGKMKLDEQVLQHVTDIFEKKLKRPMIERNRLQAMVPDCCTVLHNARGTAPGMRFEKNGVQVVSLPGVPHEMKGLMEDAVIPFLHQHFTRATILHKTLLTAGVGESFLAERIQSWERSLPEFLSLAYLPSYGMVRLRLTGRGTDDQKVSEALNRQFDQLLGLVEDILVTDRDETMEQVVGRLLLERGQTVGTAESCTGGYIAHLLTKHPGSSGFYQGSIISYSNPLKHRLLQVSNETLQSAGAVSEETVKQMAESARQQLQSDFALAVSGIMGPGGGTEVKPVGLVWIAVAGPEHVRAQSFQFRFDRARNIELTALQALNLVRKAILGKESKEG